MGGLLVTLLAAMEIHAAGGCPGAAEIERQLTPLLGPGPEAHTSDVATIERGPDGALTVALHDAQGASIEERRLPPAGSCRDQAETVAVTLAIWEAQIHPEISLRLDRLSAGAAAAPAIVARVEVSATPPPARAAAATLALGAAVAGDWQQGAAAPAGRLELSAARKGEVDDSRWRARLAVVGVGRHTLALPPGRATWARAFVALGVERALARGRRWSFGVGASAVGGIAVISGAGYAVDRGTTSLDFGGEASARVAFSAGRVHPWLGVSVVGWARRQQLELQGVVSSSALPRWEPMAALGADLFW
jgi:hypothetical protein